MMNESDKEFIRQLDEAVENRVKMWITRAALTQVVALLIPTFFLGGIYLQGKAAIDLLSQQQTELARRAGWMESRERWEMAMENWAGPQGFVPPRYKREDEK